MKILFIHQNFPAQFKHLAKIFAEDKNNEVKFICRYPNKVIIDGVEKIVSKPITKNKNQRGHRYLRTFNEAVYMGQAGWRACKRLKDQGFEPDIIYAHSGWGDSMFVKDIFPKAPYIAYMEFFYRAFGADIGFLPNTKVTEDDIARTRVRNANHLINLEACDWAISPTNWQASLHPKDFYHKFSVIHEGVDTDIIKPVKKKRNELLIEKSKIPFSSELITYITRTCEQYRGFEQAMEAISILLEKRPNATFIIVGKNGAGYGPNSQEIIGYKERILGKMNLNSDRVYCYNYLPYDKYIEVLQHSTVHIYLTVPFVLSWSMIEAMSAGCAVVASNTKPVQEVIRDGENGMLADFFNPSEIAEKVELLLKNPKMRQTISKNARRCVESKYSIKKIIPDYIKLIKGVMKQKIDARLQKKLNPKKIAP